jgi:anaerobic selenocysteine-containing dehydrogenase
VGRWVLGVAELKQHFLAKRYTTAWAAAVTDVPEAQIRELADSDIRSGHVPLVGLFCNCATACICW